MRREHVLKPPLLSPRADPQSDEARLLGPLSKRLEANVRWRFFANEAKKVHPPLQVSVRRIEKANDDTGVVTETESTRLSDLAQHGLEAGALQDVGVWEHLRDLAVTVTDRSRLLTRRERNALAVTDAQRRRPGEQPKPKILPRWLRRRHQSLLARLPLLCYSINHTGRRDNLSNQTLPSGKYEVSVPAAARAYEARQRVARLHAISETDLAWIHRAEQTKKKTVEGYE